MIDLYIWIAVWVVILIIFIKNLMKIESRLADDRINKMFEYLKKREREKMTMPRYIDNDVDYDPCDECHEKGYDYYQDEDGDWMMRCYDCPLWEGRTDDDRNG